MEVKTTVLTTELYPLISALKNEMQKEGYSPSSMRGLENVWDALLRYASTNTAFVWIWSTPCTEPAVRLSY